jgi:hypothetical protein
MLTTFQCRLDSHSDSLNRLDHSVKAPAATTSARMHQSVEVHTMLYKENPPRGTQVCTQATRGNILAPPDPVINAAKHHETRGLTRLAAASASCCTPPLSASPASPTLPPGRNSHQSCCSERYAPPTMLSRPRGTPRGPGPGRSRAGRRADVALPDWLPEKVGNLGGGAMAVGGAVL